MPVDRKGGSGESLEPLLSVSVDVPDVTDTEDIQNQPRQNDVGAKKSVQKALYRDPREAIKWLESEGTHVTNCMPISVCHTAALFERLKRAMLMMRPRMS